jgi:WD40 repeat protein
VVLSPLQDKLFIVQEDGLASVWDWESKNRIVKFDESFSESNQIQFSPDETKIITVQGNHSIVSWDVSIGRSMEHINFATEALQILSVSLNGTKAAVSHSNKNLQIIDYTNKNVLFDDPEMMGIQTAIFSPDGNLLLVGMADSIIKLLDVQTHTEIVTHNIRINRISTITFSQDCTKLAVGMITGETTVWDIQNGSSIILNPNPISKVNSIGFSQAGKTILTGYQDGNVRVWSL